jgi:hypothetical protein
LQGSFCFSPAMTLSLSMVRLWLQMAVEPFFSQTLMVFLQLLFTCLAKYEYAVLERDLGTQSPPSLSAGHESDRAAGD